MALIQCPECSKDVSDQSQHCPHCGYQLKGMTFDEKKKMSQLIGKILGGILLIGVAALIYDACTVSHAEAVAELHKATESLYETQDRLNDLRVQQALNDFFIGLYEK